MHTISLNMLNNHLLDGIMHKTKRMSLYNNDARQCIEKVLNIIKVALLKMPCSIKSAVKIAFHLIHDLKTHPKTVTHCHQIIVFVTHKFASSDFKSQLNILESSTQYQV